MNFLHFIKSLFTKKSVIEQKIVLEPVKQILKAEKKINYPSSIKEIVSHAEIHGWKLGVHQENICMVSFFKGENRINYYYSTGTIATCLKHPKMGKTQLFRKNLKKEKILLVFENPRVHTNKGYYEKH